MVYHPPPSVIETRLTRAFPEERLRAVARKTGLVERRRNDDDGYLQPVLDSDHEHGEVGYLEVRSALTRVDASESYRSVANDVPNLSRVSLSRIHKDDERREWYLDVTAEDERIDEALNQVRTDGLY